MSAIKDGREGMKNRYFDFLCSIVGVEHNGNKFVELLWQLHGMVFYALVPNDANRGVDGEQLRDKYIDEVGPQGSSSLPGTGGHGQCTVLEMMIALAYRIEFDMSGSQWDRSVAEWFWLLVENLGLTWAEDGSYAHDETPVEVGNIVSTMLDRRYKRNGRGGLFPLKTAKMDQRKVELWYQMNYWLNENYSI
jgi:hypothetical protein